MRILFFRNIPVLLLAYVLLSCNPVISTPQSTMNENKTQRLWQQVDSLQKAGMPKAAMDIVNQIQRQIIPENNHPEFIRTILYQIRLSADFEEDHFEKSIVMVDKYIANTTQPSLSILNSIQAELYYRYFSVNRHLILSRTVIEGEPGDDIKTWDVRSILQKAVFHYEQSLSAPEELKKLHASGFSEILEEKEGSKVYRPTLYDILAQRALDFFTNPQATLIQVNDPIELNNESLFEPAEKFVNTATAKPGELSFNYHALTLFKKLIGFHIIDKTPLALIDVDLKRLAWIKENITLEKKDESYMKALEQLEQQYYDSQAFPEIAYAISTELIREGNTYNPLDNPEPRLKLKEAKIKLETAIRRFPDLPSTKNCINLNKQISEPVLNIQLEYVNLPGKPFKALVSHRNVKELYLRIIGIAPETDRELRQKYHNTKELIDQYLKIEPYFSWKHELPDDGDMQMHNTEIPVQALPLGYYIVIAGFDESYNNADYELSFESFWISALSFVSRTETDGSVRFLVLDRDNGKPLKNVTATLWQERYNQSLRRYDIVKGPKYTTNTDGEFTIEADDSSGRTNRMAVELTLKNDRLMSDHYFYVQPYIEQKYTHTQTHFFTDRALYRPGQTIYLKGVMIDTDGKDHRLKTNFKTNVVLYDANYQKISELIVTTNDYGSFAGSFVIPSGLLTGSFQLSNQYGNKSFSVEEYKLPRFKVDFDTIKSNYKLGESVTVQGQALAFAGNPINNAEVKFRVTRQIRFPYPFYRTGIYYPSSPPAEIMNGTAKTDANGNFTVTFNAIPDPGLSKERNPVFIFNIMADVTDINGETQSGSTSIGIGYVALLLSAEIPDMLNQEAFKGFRIDAKNMNGIDQEVTGEISIQKLIQPKKLFRERPFSRPDRFILDKATHDKMFPFDVYDNEDDPSSWGVEKRMFAGKFNTGSADRIIPDGFQTWTPGTYLIEIKSKDAFGEPVEFRKYFTVYSEINKTVPVSKPWWSELLTTDPEPGQNARILIGSKIQLTVLYEIEINGSIVESRRLNINNSTMLITIPVTERHVGGFRVLFTAVAQNRVFTETLSVNVPDKSKQLNIKLETKRNRLEPGGKEEWKVFIGNYKGEPEKAELLAGMYDASLDVLMPHNWALTMYDRYRRQLNWNAGAAFRQISLHAGVYTSFPEYFHREYDKLNWFGFDMYAPVFFDFRSGGRHLTKSRNLAPDSQALMEESYAVADDAVSGGDSYDEQPEHIRAEMPSLMIRRDLRETAFFYPQLLSDKDGVVTLNFTVPESLTRWRLMGLAHTKDLRTSMLDEFFESGRELMVIPNPPRFLRQGDEMQFRAKVVNITDKELVADVSLNFFDALTMASVNESYILVAEQKKIVIPPHDSRDIFWDIKVPDKGAYAIIYRVAAIAGSHSDGEENMLPVLTNRQLITESMPMFAGSNENKTFVFDKLLKSGKSGSTAVNHQLTLEFTSNPVWYVVQALPYLSEPNSKSAEAIFQQYYTNQLALHIINRHPEIERVFRIWQKTDPNALLSNLEKNQDLKTAVIEETPWLSDALGESEQKRQIALLFDRDNIASMLKKSFRELLDMQLENGGWSWFPGMPDSRHVTQQLVAGFGRLQALGIEKIMDEKDLYKRMQQAVLYIDEKMTEEYNKLQKPVDPKTNHLHPGVIHYLWARSYWTPQFPLNGKHQESFAFWKDQAERYWTGQQLYFQGMIAIALHNLSSDAIAGQIIASVADRALISEEMGMYWRDLRQGLYWYEAPVETQALLIEAFADIGKDMQKVEKMQQWLIKQKQTHAWKSSRATAEAVYAILMRGTQSFGVNKDFSVQIGNLKINPATYPAVKEEAGSGYFRISFNGDEIKPEMAEVIVNNPGNTIVWGGLYWQYFEQLDRITAHETPLKLKRSIMREVLMPAGPVLETITDNKLLKIGDKMVMRIELKVDRDMEYVHMKDLRAPAFEPVEQISGYRYKGGLGYYENPRDLATHFFFQYLPKGTWVFEYPVIVSQTGDFSTGITSIQCLYAPEFSAHSEGIRVDIK
ncbi:MAG: hypothetical protein GX128_04440 [Bacteroidales bacterium]|jgi:hypothetical protein|nr:hypothetical protein [Bacteroidales bacterium]